MPSLRLFSTLTTLALATAHMIPEDSPITAASTCTILPHNPANASDLAACNEIIKAAANTACTVDMSHLDQYPGLFCTYGTAQVWGVGTNNFPGPVSDLCGNVAKTVGEIMDECTYRNMTTGQKPIYGHEYYDVWVGEKRDCNPGLVNCN